MTDKENDFWTACRTGNLDKAKSLSTQVDFNRRDVDGWTGLHYACAKGSKQVAKYLLTLTQIDVNKETGYGSTPLFFACEMGEKEIVKMLVEDRRVDVNKEDHDGQTPLWAACRWGSERAAKVLLASSRKIDTTRRTKVGSKTTPTEMARKEGFSQLAALVEEYERNPKELAQRLREELDWPTPASAVFAQMIFLCDGLLELSAREEPAQRFFSIASRLPLDLQHLLANRSQGLAADHVPTADRELAFTSLAGAFREN